MQKTIVTTLPILLMIYEKRGEIQAQQIDLYYK